MTKLENIGTTGNIFGTINSVEYIDDQRGRRRIVIITDDDSAAMVQTGSPVIFHTDILVPESGDIP